MRFNLIEDQTDLVVQVFEVDMAVGYDRYGNVVHEGDLVQTLAGTTFQVLEIDELGSKFTMDPSFDKSNSRFHFSSSCIILEESRECDIVE